MHPRVGSRRPSRAASPGGGALRHHRSPGQRRAPRRGRRDRRAAGHPGRGGHPGDPHRGLASPWWRRRSWRTCSVCRTCRSSRRSASRSSPARDDAVRVSFVLKEIELLASHPRGAVHRGERVLRRTRESPLSTSPAGTSGSREAPSSAGTTQFWSDFNWPWITGHHIGLRGRAAFLERTDTLNEFEEKQQRAHAAALALSRGARPPRRGFPAPDRGARIVTGRRCRPPTRTSWSPSRPASAGTRGTPGTTRREAGRTSSWSRRPAGPSGATPTSGGSSSTSGAGSGPPRTSGSC